MDYNFLSVEEFLCLEESGTLLEIGTYEGKDAETGVAVLRRRHLPPPANIHSARAAEGEEIARRQVSPHLPLLL